MKRMYHFRFKDEEGASGLSRFKVEATNLSAALNAIAKAGLSGRTISNAWHTGMSEASGMISLHELIGRQVPDHSPPRKKMKDLSPEFDFVEEVEAQCKSKTAGASHE